MRRIRVTLPRGTWSEYRHLDLVHDAIVNALTAAGASSREVVGVEAEPWSFAALGFHRRHEGRVHSLVVSTPRQVLTKALDALDAAPFATRGQPPESSSSSPRRRSLPSRHP